MFPSVCLLCCELTRRRQAEIATRESELTELQRENERLRCQLTRAVNESESSARIDALESELQGKDGELQCMHEANENLREDKDELEVPSPLACFLFACLRV